MTPDATYISLPSPERSPDRLFVIASLLGLKPTPLSDAKVLDIGSGQGWDLIALACAYPKTSFLGIDRSATAIAAGKEAIAKLDLNNIDLTCLDLQQFNTAQKFDYIICHGVYSWVPEDTALQIFKICQDKLSDNGLAYISYNALPAWTTRGILREALRRFVKSGSQEAKIAKARSIIETFSATLQDYQSPYAMSLKLELEQAKKASDGFIIQELLSDYAYAEYLDTFIAKAQQHHLHYLAEAKFERMISERLDELAETPELCRVVRSLDSFVAKEQVLEFVFPTWLRQSILCKESVPDRPNTLSLSTEALADLYIASPLVPTLPSDPEGGDDIFMNPSGSYIKISNEHLCQTLNKLHNTWPDWIPVKSLYEMLSFHSSYTLNNFAGDLGLLFRKGLIELHGVAAPFTNDATEKPLISPLARLQVQQQHWLTNLKQEYTLFTDFEKHLIPLLDGTRTKEELKTELKDLLSSEELTLKEEFRSEAANLDLDTLLSQAIDEALKHFAESALFPKIA
ncbi:MAG: methyltransferase domain-containing protein [Bdellovibrionota bacterium]|jgi:2-polyprenyl-3-methyl-5-hydroxy-6-metoxy-1,4-benzoquinol methylase/methyltransferase-like protein